MNTSTWLVLLLPEVGEVGGSPFDDLVSLNGSASPFDDDARSLILEDHGVLILVGSMYRNTLIFF
jgi:hypothetical protein